MREKFAQNRENVNEVFNVQNMYKVCRHGNILMMLMVILTEGFVLAQKRAKTVLNLLLPKITSERLSQFVPEVAKLTHTAKTTNTCETR